MTTELLTKARMTAEERCESHFRKARARMGPSPALDAFFSKYAKATTRSSYITHLVTYFAWLKERKGVAMTPDELVKDNLVCLFKSKDPTDVQTKARHLGWMNEYVNVYLLSRDVSESKRVVSSAVISQFYEKNNSKLWGDFSIAQERVQRPPKALEGDEIRRVLASLPVHFRAPLLVSWQSGIEINRVLDMEYPPLDGAPLKLELYGRKGHRRGYWTYIGAEGVELLKMIEGRGMPAYSTLRKEFKGAAMRLFRKGLIRNGDPRAWHAHALRHNFSTECSHAGVRAEVREFWMGHIAGVSWVYQHPEIHEADMEKEYRKVLPFVSLEATEVSLRQEFDEERKSWLEEIAALRREMAEARTSSR